MLPRSMEYVERPQFYERLCDRFEYEKFFRTPTQVAHFMLAVYIWLA